ncbi:uncharacterized protein A4U43_C01F6650 [Asparagus officinalis]|uniref:WRKY domain-containing protein n=1 Tax=Asparagus officinalis TaxID=4686 RepID=A0A5P1FMD2_ASPOF|nr:probable WRKY transcription factor 27 [Asparagus officinalis]ONK79466.1 uncharacterized protein A4U43_C01F6650 [Asparagus officinalis]
MENANNWDLYAVVRGCGATTSATLDPFNSYTTDNFIGNYEAEGNLSLPDLTTTNDAVYELEDLCKPFFLQSQHKPQQETQRQSSHSIPRSKRRGKNQQKKVVCQVPADGLSSDMWAWRKYGQKPIKGSPYPRGYYRCSSSKACLARKQVERSQTDPTMLILTYTGEHNHPVPTHRNSLAGSTRNKFPSQISSNKKNLSTLSGNNMTGLSPTTPLINGVEEENDDNEEEDMMVMDSEKLVDHEIEGEDLVEKFFSDIWQAENNAE